MLISTRPLTLSVDLPTAWTTTLKRSLQVCPFHHVPAPISEFRGSLIKALTFCSVPLFHSAFHLSTRIPILSSLLSAVCSTAGASNGSKNHSTVYHKNLPCINDDATVGNNECPPHRTVPQESALSSLFSFNLRASVLSPWSDYWMEFFLPPHGTPHSKQKAKTTFIVTSSSLF